MRLLSLLLVVCILTTNCFAQSLSLTQFSALCNGSPNIDIENVDNPDGNGYEEISGMTICGNIANTAVTVQENGVLRQFTTEAYSDAAPFIGDLGSIGPTATDFESITYLFENSGIFYYAAGSEDESKIAVFSIYLDANDALVLDIDINNGQPIFLTVKNSAGVPIPKGSDNNKGLEGLTYNPNTGKIYFAKESPPKLYESQNTFFNISDFVNVSDVSANELAVTINVNPGEELDFSGLHHLNLSPATPNQNLIIAITEKSGKAYLLNILNQQANEIESFQFTNLHAGAKIEGVVYNNNTLIVCNDNDEVDQLVYSDFYSYTNQGVNGVLGDVDCDGVLTINDAYLTSQYAVGLSNQSCTFDQIAGDINRDGVVDINDAYAIARCSVNLQEYYCPCKIE